MEQGKPYILQVRRRVDSNVNYRIEGRRLYKKRMSGCNDQNRTKIYLGVSNLKGC